MANDCFVLARGTSPLLISFPHVGTQIPQELHERLVPRALDVEDTDWYVHQIYAFAAAMGAGMLVSNYSRYVIDLNRPPDNTPMYGGANNTALCPTTFFNGDPLYRTGSLPAESEISLRRTTYWEPYHHALQVEIERIKSIHGYALLFDAHSIKSQVPWLFEGRLPDLNLGTVKGASCASGVRAALIEALNAQQHFSHVTDGRFSGGYITRQYGRPDNGVHAIQLEMAWRCYMKEETPYKIDPRQAATLEPVLGKLIHALLSWKPH